MAAATTHLVDLGHAQRERLRFIEASLLWEGSVRRQRVSEVFDISKNHVTKDLRCYETAFPNNILFDHRRQLYVPGARFKPHLASRDPGEYLALQLAYAETGSRVVAPLLAGWDTVPTSTVPTPPHGIQEAVLRAVVRAITTGTAVDLRYFSTQANGPARRHLWPHSLVHTGVRWHVRAYDGERQTFRNFALQRMEDPKAVEKPSPLPAHEDADWVNATVLRVVPNPRLNPHQRELVARDFGMQSSANGPVWLVELRHSLIGYFAAKYNLDRDEKPTQQRIVLENVADARPWFLKGTDVSREPVLPTKSIKE